MLEDGPLYRDPGGWGGVEKGIIHRPVGLVRGMRIYHSVAICVSSRHRFIASQVRLLLSLIQYDGIIGGLDCWACDADGRFLFRLLDIQGASGRAPSAGTGATSSS